MLRLVLISFYQLFMAVILVTSFPFFVVGVALVPRWRKYFFMRLGIVPGSEGKCTVIYAPSVGETFSAVRLVNSLKADPAWKNCIFIGASMTPEGKNVFEKHGLKGVMFPIDFFVFVVLWFNRIKPQAVIIVEGELWPCFLYVCWRRHIPVAVVAGRAGRSRKTLKHIIRMLLLPGADAVKLAVVKSKKHLGYYRCILSGKTSLKVGGTLKLRNVPVQPLSEKIFDVVWVSFHKGEEKYFYESLKHIAGYHLFAPRKVELVDAIKKNLENMGVKLWTYSHSGLVKEKEGVLILDTIGHLPALICKAKIAVIGGSFVKKGAHNVYEPLSQGIPVITGPFYWNYEEEVEEAVKRGCAGVAKSSSELIELLHKFLHKRSYSGDFAWIHELDGMEVTVRELNTFKEKEMLC